MSATRREAALSYARAGLPVLPLAARGKRPLVANGVHDATTDAGQVAEWWRRHPDANVGLAAFPFWVLDVDGPDGERSFLRLVATCGRLPRTPKQITGKGFHVLFAADPRIKNATALVPGLDTRSAGGYVVAAPSLHESGRVYRWAAGQSPLEIPFAPAPEWMLRFAEPEVRPEPPKPAPVQAATAYGRSALGSAVHNIPRIPIGEQATRLDWEAYGIGQLVAGGQLVAEEARAALVEAGLRMANQQGREPWTRQDVQFRVDRQFRRAAGTPRAGSAA